MVFSSTVPLHSLSQRTLMRTGQVAPILDVPLPHRRTKHIEIDIHFVREKLALGEVRVPHVPTSAQYADIFTKGLPSAAFIDIQSSLNVVQPAIALVFIIISDLPYDEIHDFRKETIENELEMILHTTPATPLERVKEITKASEGFVYLVSVAGVTGARETVNPRVKDLLQGIRQVTNKAVAVSFSISTLEHVSQIAGCGADRVIIGSAMVKQLGEPNSPREGLNRLEVYARSLKNALP
nr:indole-3-glycerol phosphate lyase, chloroplastic-like [Aegilops tauschii subsp. strangulata]